MKNIIEKYRLELEKNMFEHCNIFVCIGSPSENPRYYNLGKVFNTEGKYYLQIKSTQVTYLFFNFEITKNDYEYILFDCESEFWNEFKIFRTEFLTNNYPTIKTI